jgi:hypothetical protein
VRRADPKLGGLGRQLLGPGAGLWHRIPAGQENLRVHRRFFKDIENADAVAALSSRSQPASR